MNSKTLSILQSIVALFWGAFIASLIGLIASLSPIFEKIFNKIIYSAILEEGLKYTVVFFLISQIRLKPKSIPFVGMGFGLLEVFARLQGSGYAYIKPFGAHIVFGLVMALFVYLAQKSKTPFKGLFYGLALIVPIFLHISYNLIVIGL